MARGRDAAALEALDRQLAHPTLQVGRREHAEHSLQLVRHADAADARVRERAAHERDVGRAGRVDVVEVARPAAQDALVLPAADRAADQPAGAHQLTASACASSA
jgi:hypothetical protein